jgi:hypothetical protein
MANIKISELNPLLTVEDADVLPIVDNAVTKKVTAAILRSYTQGNSVLLTGNQTIAGIKTFTAQLASTVATGTAPFSVASTTKVTNLNADLLDGLSSADFQATLSGTGIVKSTAGTISYLTDNSSNWNTAFNDSIVSAAVTGTTTKLLTLNQQDGGTITASWTDDNTDAVSSVFGRTGAVVATSGDYTTTQVTEGTNLYYTEARVDANSNVAANTAARHNAVTLGTANGLSLSTQALSLALASGSTTGALSSTDWTTFNNKQNALTNPITGTGTTNYLPKFTGASALGDSLIFDNGTNIGIGTATPSAKLELASGNIRLTNTAQIEWGGGANSIDASNATNVMRFYTNNLERININSSGYVGIGTATAFSKLSIAGAGGSLSAVSAIQFYDSNSGGSRNFAWSNGAGGNQVDLIGKFILSASSAVNGDALTGNALMAITGSGNVGIGTTTPLGILHLYKAGETTRMVIDGDPSQSKIITYRTNGLQRFGMYVNNTPESGSNVGSDFQIRAYSDAGTLLTTPLFIKRSSGNVGVNTITPAYTLDVNGTARVTGQLTISNTNDVYSEMTTSSVDGDNFFGFSNTGDANSAWGIGRRNTGEFWIANYTGNFLSGTRTTPLVIASTGAATFSSSVAGASFLAGTRTILGAGFIADISSTGNNTGIFFDGGGILPTNGAGSYTVKNLGSATYPWGAATFSSSVTATNGYISASYNAGDVITWGGIAPYANIYGALAWDVDKAIVKGRGGYALGLYVDDNVSKGITIATTGAAKFSAGLALSNATAPASGIEFPATQVASASANNLDDYEEGTWTMGVAFGGASVGVTYAVNTGTYTKIGRQVTVNGYIVLTSKGSSTTTARITGLPFLIGGDNPYHSVPSLRLDNITFTNQFQAFGVINTSTIALQEITILGIVSNLTDADFANNSDIMVSFTYFV